MEHAIPAASIDPQLCEQLRAVAATWHDSPVRPRPTQEVSDHWDRLTRDWVEDRSLPLLVRRTKKRGVEQRHGSGRNIVHTDNSPAHWTLGAALLGRMPTLDEVMADLERGELPVTFALSREDKRRMPKFTGLLGRSSIGSLLYKGRWKVCHIDPVGLGGRKPTFAYSMAELAEVSTRLLSPTNMFLVPNSHSGLGELPEVIDHFRRCREAR